MPISMLLVTDGIQDLKELVLLHLHVTTAGAGGALEAE